MAHVEKHNRASVYPILCHIERREGINLSNKMIDKSRSHLNYNLAEELQSMPASAFISKRLRETNVKVKKNSVTLFTWIITKPKAVKVEDTDYFFKEVYEYLTNLYGAENVVCAWVHKDETTEHLHMGIMPIVKDEDNKYRLCTREIITRSHLKSFHGKLNEHMAKKLGYDPQLLNPDIEKRGIHYGSVDELKKVNSILDTEYEVLTEKLSEGYERLSEINDLIENDEVISEVYELKKENKRLKQITALLKEIFDTILEYLENIGMHEVVDYISNMFEKKTQEKEIERL